MYKTKYLECCCYSAEHTIRLSYEDDDTRMLYIEPYLFSYKNIFQRAWAAVKYVFGRKSKHGHFDCMILERPSVEELRDELNLFLNTAKQKSEA